MKLEIYTILAVILIVFASGMITIVSNEDIDASTDTGVDATVVPEVGTGGSDDGLEARATRGAASRVPAEYMSLWSDTFTTADKIAVNNGLTVSSGVVKLGSADGKFANEGNITSIPIVPKSESKWYRFYANSSSYNFKRIITIDNTQNSNNLAGYVIYFQLNTKSLISAGKMRTDAGDIRFYDSSGNELSYWIGSGVNTEYTDIWVNVTSIPALAKTYIYMDYGHPTLTSKSNGKNTFWFFDDFSSGNLNYWTAIESFTGPYGVSGGELYMHSETGTTGSLRLKGSKPYDSTLQYIISFDFKLTQDGTRTDAYVRWGNDDWDTGYAYRIENMFATSHTLGQWYNYKIYTDQNNWYIDRKLSTDTSWSSMTSGPRSGSYESVTSGSIILDVDHTNADVIKTRWDNVRVHSYSTPVPDIIVGDEPAGGESGVSFKILDAEDDSLIISVSDGDDLSCLPVEKVKLRADFFSNGWGSAFLNDWGIEWNTLPVIDDVSSKSDKMKRNETMVIKISAFDHEEANTGLTVKVEYRSPYDIYYQTEYLSDVVFGEVQWETTFSPPKDAKTGLYKFRICCNDSACDSSNYGYDFTITVLNNQPVTPAFSVSPAKPITSDNLKVTVSSAYDIETASNELEYWYRWYKDDVHVPDFDNKSMVPNYATAKNQNWKVVLHLFDGEDFGPASEASVKIENGAPVIIESVGPLVIKEDEVDVGSVNLRSTFMDPDNDGLTYYASGQQYVNVEIDQESGIVTLIPKENWHGTDDFSIVASDGTLHTSLNLTLTVNPQNDPPELIKAGSVEVESPGLPLRFTVNENSWINLSFVAIDIDGDKFDFATNRTDFLENDDIEKMDLNKDILIFHPDNSHIGEIPVNLSISDTNGGTSYYNLILVVKNVNNRPSVDILSPADGMHFVYGKSIGFQCDYSDPDLLIKNSDESLEFSWSTNRKQGPFATGTNLNSLEEIYLEPGTHIITVIVKDKAGATSSDQITVVVEEEEVEGLSSLSGTAGMMLIIVIIIIIIIVFYLFLFLRRRKRMVRDAEYIPPHEKTTYVTKPGAIEAPTYTMDQVQATPEAQQLPMATAVPGQPPAAVVHQPAAAAPAQAAAEIQKQQSLPPAPEGAPAARAQPVAEETPRVTMPQEGEPVAVVGVTKPVVTLPGEQAEAKTEQVDKTKDLIAQLEKLGELKEKGFLTEEEFKKKKEELLKK